MTVSSAVQRTMLVPHLIGGRAGWGGFPVLHQFHDSIQHVIFEADESCTHEIVNYWRDKPRPALVFPYFLWSAAETVDFHITTEPFASSIYRFNERFSDYCVNVGGVDYPYRSVFEVARTVRVQTHPLDTLVNACAVPAPDFIAVDTQGSELEILRGAEGSLLSAPTVGVAIEVSFAEIYKGVPLFAEVDSYLRSKGFVLADLDILKGNPVRAAIGVTSDGFPVQGEALYLRSLHEQAWTTATQDDKLVSLHKLAFVALAYGKVEYALEALQLADQIGITPAIATALAPMSYMKTLREFRQIAADAPYAATFLEQPVSVTRPRLRTLLRSDPTTFVRLASGYAKSVMRRYATRFPVKVHIEKSYSPIEQFLLDRGLTKAARIVRHKRLG